MAVTGYFYNAHKDEQGNYDIEYNNEDFCRYLKGLVGNGVFPTPSTQLQVTKGSTAMHVNVDVGDAWIEGHKVSNDSTLDLTFTAADPIYDRIDRVVIYTDTTARMGGIEIITGEVATSPVAPDLIRTNERYELCLANVFIKHGETDIGTITDTRADSSVCGWVAGLVQQLDLSTIFVQWENAYEQEFQSMLEWQAQMRSEFDTWYSALTSELTVGAYIETYKKVVDGGSTVSNVISLDMLDYSYSFTDVFFVTMNGFLLTRGTVGTPRDYVVSDATTPATITLTAPSIPEGNTVEIMVMKSNMTNITGDDADEVLYPLEENS